MISVRNRIAKLKLALSAINCAAVLLLLIPWASAQATQCAPDGSPKLRFVTQLRVSGCALFVHDTGANDGPHLAVEPIMCVTESLHKVEPRYDPVTQQTYVSVPVMLRDDDMLTEVRRQLQHLSPKSVNFATVSDINVSSDASSKFHVFGFHWSPDKPVGFVELSCRLPSEYCNICHLVSRIRGFQFEALDQLIMSASITLNNTEKAVHSMFKYRLMVQNRTFFDAGITFDRLNCLLECQQLRFIRSIHLSNCTARVHQRLDMKGHFLIEPLLCHNITSMSSESVMYDYSRDMYYLKLDVVLQDDMAVNAVTTQLADLSSPSVTFMRLLGAQIHVASGLSRHFEVGPLMVSGDGRSAELRVYCRTEEDCVRLRAAVIDNPGNLWSHVRYSVITLAPFQCLLKPEFPRHSWVIQEIGKSDIYSDDSACKTAFDGLCPVGLRCGSDLMTTATPATSYPVPATRNTTSTTGYSAPATRFLASATRYPARTTRYSALTTGYSAPATRFLASATRFLASATRNPARPTRYTAPTTGYSAQTTVYATPAVRISQLERDGRQFAVIQQRISGNVSFQRSWAEYESGFGDGSNFWIGLSTIHSLSMNGATLRVEMQLWNWTKLNAEYAEFKVGDASTNYTMTYLEMLKDRSNLSFDAMEIHEGMQFSTMDRDNDRHCASCSCKYGSAGWWFNRCHHSNPNGIYHHGNETNPTFCSWKTGSLYTSLRTVRLMLQTRPALRDEKLLGQ